MNGRLRVLFLPHATSPDLFTPWGEDVIAAIGERHEVSIFDSSKPVKSQVDGIAVVIDHSGISTATEMLDASGSVRLWQVLGTGVDHLNLAESRSRRILVANCPGTITAAALADCALMMMLMVARRYRQASRNLDQGIMYVPAGEQLNGRHLSLIGFGASGRELAKRAVALDMRVSAIDAKPIGPDEARAANLEFAGTPDDIDRLLGRSDYVSLHLPLSTETHHVIDRRRLALMHSRAILINVARGELVDEEALAEALVGGRLGGAGLDVFGIEPPDSRSSVYQLPNVVVTPHIAGATVDASRLRARFVADNVDRVAEGLRPLHIVE